MFTIINALRIIISRYGFISLIVFNLGVADQVLAARDAGEKRECATCHIMWIKDFKRKDVKTLIPYDPMPVEITGKQDVVSTEKMCFSCHDGFVLDSRKSWKKGSHGHPVGMKPSRKIKIPTKDGKTVFPLNEDGKVYCGTCHTAHGVSWSEEDSPVFMRVRNKESGICLACHLDKSTGPAEGNHPVFKTMHKPLSEKLKMMGAQSGDKNTVICQTCHVAHGAKTSKSHLVVNPENDRLCSVCHEDKQSVINSKHDLRKSHPDAKNIKGHTAANLGVCSSCHVPHGANGPSLWAGQEADTNVDVTAAACLGCHSKNGIAKEKALTKYNHPVGMPITRTGINVVNGKWKSESVLYDPDKPSISLPLYDKHGKHVENDGDVGCGSCHDPHKKLSAEAKEDDNEKTKHKQVDFLRISENSGSKLCINCHIKERSILLSKHNPEIYKSDDDANTNVCESCHQVHHATTSPLWARDLGPGQASVESLCNDCHRKEGIAEKKLTGKHSHPVSVAAQKMSKSGLPLYGRNEASSGSVIDCATCHNLH
ncbi:MAG: hypothetical protein OEZ38_11005, partial [Gammaproteobacteria bacterium]|nr:hypothetical protein [Gammaproteobacteria bacterium]